MARNPDKLVKRKQYTPWSLSLKSHQRGWRWLVWEVPSVFVERNLLDKPHKVHNEDETGFTIGSKTGVVVGPSRQKCTFYIYQTGQQNTACQWCIVTVLKELFYHPSMCTSIQNPIANLQLMIFCKVQQEATLFITHQKDWWIQMLSLHSYTIFITKKTRMTDQLYFWLTV